jgi:hypothetical protein
MLFTTQLHLRKNVRDGIETILQKHMHDEQCVVLAFIGHSQAKLCYLISSRLCLPNSYSKQMTYLSTSITKGLPGAG